MTFLGGVTALTTMSVRVIVPKGGANNVLRIGLELDINYDDHEMIRFYALCEPSGEVVRPRVMSLTVLPSSEGRKDAP